jgi:glycosyltransferase involved in cell wall biosynthesis
MVVAEAMSYTLPVICFDNYGPGELIGDEAGIKIPYSTYNQSIEDFAKALKELYINTALYDTFSKGARRRFENYYTWNAKGDALKSIYEDILDTGDKNVNE